MKLRTLKYLFIAFGVLYVLSPLDLIPDFAGLISRVDDLIIVLALMWRYAVIADKYKKQYEYYKEKLRQATASKGSDSSSKSGKTSKAIPTPHEVLELDQSATSEEIDTAYKRLIKLYHPDKVSHLGKDLVALANDKTVQITSAYQKLKS